MIFFVRKSLLNATANAGSRQLVVSTAAALNYSKKKNLINFLCMLCACIAVTRARLCVYLCVRFLSNVCLLSVRVIVKLCSSVVLVDSMLWTRAHVHMAEEEGGLTQVVFWPQQLLLREAAEKTERKPVMGPWRCPDNWESCRASYVDSLPDRAVNRCGWRITKPMLLLPIVLMFVTQW